MALLCLVYFFLTAYRDFRDSYGVDVLKILGYGDRPGLLSITESLVGLALLIAMAALYLVGDNRRALLWAFVVMIAGTMLMGARRCCSTGSRSRGPPGWSSLVWGHIGVRSL